MGEKEHHRVHFPESEDTFGKNNEIVIEGSSDRKSISIHLGFLQVGHRYQIAVEFPDDICSTLNFHHLLIPQCVPGKVQSVNCKVMALTKTDSGFHMKLEFLAYKEKLLKEQLFLDNRPSLEMPGNLLVLTFIARVLGKGKGTPMLKNGIHCIGVELDDESEASDWQGFN